MITLRTQTDVENFTKDIINQRGNIILQQLNDLLDNKVLVIKYTKPILTVDSYAQKVKMEQGIRLSFKGEEEFANLKVENAELKSQLELIRDVLKKEIT